MVATIPKSNTYILVAWIKKQSKPTIEPIKLDRTRSKVNFCESLPSGEITKIMDSNVQKSSIFGNCNIKRYPAKKPSTHRKV